MGYSFEKVLFTADFHMERHVVDNNVKHISQALSAMLSYSWLVPFSILAVALKRAHHHALADMMVLGMRQGTAGPGDTQGCSCVLTVRCLFSMVARPGQSFVTLVKHIWDMISLIPNSITEQRNLDQSTWESSVPVLWPWSAHLTFLDSAFSSSDAGVGLRNWNSRK